MTELSLPLPTPGALRPARSCSDAQLAQRAARGDRRAFEAIFERHHQAVYRYCRSILVSSEDAADALQNTMAAVLRGLEGETREIALKAWIFRIAHNEALSIVRRRRPQVELDDAQACPRPSLESDVLASERLRQLVADVQALPDRQRGALVMRELNDLGYDEIAAVFGVSEGAARQTVHEARTALHDLEQGRSMPCAKVRELIGARDGRLLRGRKVRAHLRACQSCAGFRSAIGERRTALGLAAPPLAAPFAASMLGSLLGAGPGGAVGAAMTTASSAPLAGAAVGGAAKVAAMSAGAKAVAVLAAAATLTGGAVVAEHEISPGGRGGSPPAQHAPLRAQPVGGRAPGATGEGRATSSTGATTRTSHASRAAGHANVEVAAAARVKAPSGTRRSSAKQRAAKQRAAQHAAAARARTKARRQAARRPKPKNASAGGRADKPAAVVHAKPKSAPATSDRPAAIPAPKANATQAKQAEAGPRAQAPDAPPGG